ncbi:deoxyribonuclease-1-like [Dromiciops gliroides]|uniref:deoxyribonuclease-1-like n=1 Tax=Dromiciops gliroides TaxID=33562 RepID=UPI001CC529CC|nr:deoxyribonuclease-1-like [Dromiciops gliroides]
MVTSGRGRWRLQRVPAGGGGSGGAAQALRPTWQVLSLPKPLRIYSITVNGGGGSTRHIWTLMPLKTSLIPGSRYLLWAPCSWVPLFLLLLLSGQLHLVSCATLRICAFNIQSFGEAKAKQPEVMSVLVKVLARCDICVVQEVRDSKGKAMSLLLRELNRADPGHQYEALESRRLGLGSYKEQNVFVYRADVVSIMDSYQVPEAEPGQAESFLRGPFVARFSWPNSDLCNLVLISHHACPRNAAGEIDQLYRVVQDVKQHWNVEDVMLLGDLNAGCTFVPPEAWLGIRLWRHPAFHWLIGDQVDTTVSTKTHCAYDRIIVHGKALLQAVVPGSAKTFNFQQELGMSEEQALQVSDHYPVEVCLQSTPQKHQEL